jgi:hypothetical protein
MTDVMTLDKLPPQKNVITLEEAENRTNYWREAIKGLYGDGAIPLGFFIPFEDIKQLVDDYTNQNIAGIRVYFTLDDAEDIGEHLSNKIRGIMVPTVLDPSILPPADPVYRDIILPVLAYSNNPNHILTKAVSIYDVTQPCPPCCDPSSPLSGV